MLELGFPYRYVQWVMVCLTTVEYIINVNGDLTEPFVGKKGIRQGDPISPYLVVICMEYLNRCLMELHGNKLFYFHPKCKRMGLTHVCFANNLLLFTRGDTQSVQQLMMVLDKFTAASGLKANQMKSSIYFRGVGEEIKQEILEYQGCLKGCCHLNIWGYLSPPTNLASCSVSPW